MLSGVHLYVCTAEAALFKSTYVMRHARMTSCTTTKWGAPYERGLHEHRRAPPGSGQDFGWPQPPICLVSPPEFLPRLEHPPQKVTPRRIPAERLWVGGDRPRSQARGPHVACGPHGRRRRGDGGRPGQAAGGTPPRRSGIDRVRFGAPLELVWPRKAVRRPELTGARGSSSLKSAKVLFRWYSANLSTGVPY